MLRSGVNSSSLCRPFSIRLLARTVRTVKMTVGKLERGLEVFNRPSKSHSTHHHHGHGPCMIDRSQYKSVTSRESNIEWLWWSYVMMHVRYVIMQLASSASSCYARPIATPAGFRRRRWMLAMHWIDHEAWAGRPWSHALYYMQRCSTHHVHACIGCHSLNRKVGSRCASESLDLPLSFVFRFCTGLTQVRKRVENIKKIPISGCKIIKNFWGSMPPDPQRKISHFALGGALHPISLHTPISTAWILKDGWAKILARSLSRYSQYSRYSR